MVDISSVVLALFVLVLIRAALQWWQMYRMSFDGMPTIFPIPVFGVNLFKLFAHVKELVVPLHKDTLKYGVIHRAWYYNHPMIVVHDPDELANVLGKSMDIFDRSKHERKGFKELLGDGLLLVPNGERWKKTRDMLTPMFHRRSLKALHEQMVKNSEILLQRIEAQIGERIDVQAEFQKLTFDTIAKITIGIDLDTQTAMAESEFGRAWHVILGYQHFRFFCPLPYWLQDLLPLPGKATYKRDIALLHRTVDAAIEAKREAIRKRWQEETTKPVDKPAEQQERGGQEDFLEFLLQEEKHGVELSTEYIREELVTLLFAGHDTTTNLLTWAVFYLCTNVACLRQVQRELDEQLGGKTPTFEQLSQLRYLRFCIKETLRLQPSAPMRGRTLTQTTTIGKWQVSAGSDVLFAPWSLHRLPSLWRDPLAFMPQRFDPDAPESKTHGNNHPYAYLPFGGGARRCIGEPLALQEAMLVLAMMLQRFEPHLAPDQRIRPVVELTMRAENGLLIQFSPRRRH